MGSTQTGELFTQQQYDDMPVIKRQELGIVGITPEESALLENMKSRKERRDWMRANKKFSKRTNARV